MVVNPHDIHTFPHPFNQVEEQGRHSHPEDPIHVMLEKLENIHTVLQAINSKQGEPTDSEITNDKFIQTLFKAGQGGNWIPNRRGRFYLYVAAPVPTALSVTSPLGPPFVLTIPAITLPGYWNLLDFPEASSVMLDSTATANQMNIHVLLTNKKL